MSSRVGPVPCWDESIHTHLELSRPRQLWLELVRAHTESSRPGSNTEPSRLEPELSWVGSMLSRVGTSRAGPSPCRAESFASDIGSSGPRPMSSRSGQFRSERTRADVGANGHRPMSGQTGSGWWRFEWVRVDDGRMSPRRCRGERVYTDVGANGPKPMSGLTGLGRCRGERARADVESNRYGPTSSQVGAGRCRAKPIPTHVEPNLSELISSRIFLSPCLAEFVRAHVEPSWFGPMASQVCVESSWFEPMSSWVSPYRCRVELTRALLMPNKSGPSRVGLSPCRAELVQTDVGSSRSRPMLSRVNPDPCRNKPIIKLDTRGKRRVLPYIRKRKQLTIHNRWGLRERVYDSHKRCHRWG